MNRRSFLSTLGLGAAAGAAELRRMWRKGRNSRTVIRRCGISGEERRASVYGEHPAEASAHSSDHAGHGQSGPLPSVAYLSPRHEFAGDIFAQVGFRAVSGLPGRAPDAVSGCTGARCGDCSETWKTPLCRISRRLEVQIFARQFRATRRRTTCFTCFGSSTDAKARS